MQGLLVISGCEPGLVDFGFLCDAVGHFVLVDCSTGCGCCHLLQNNTTILCVRDSRWEKKNVILFKCGKAVTTVNRCVCETKNMAQVKISLIYDGCKLNFLCNQLKITLCQKHFKNYLMAKG